MKSPQTEKTATACQKTPLERAKAALNGDSNDEEHDALLALVESVEACQKTPTWTDQARNAIRQGQSLNDFVSHCHIDNRRQARKAFLSARLAIIPNEQERQELMASVNNAEALAEALREIRNTIAANGGKNVSLDWIESKCGDALARWEAK